MEKARKASVTRDVIERAIGKGTGAGGEKMTLEHVAFEGYAPHKVPVIVECMTDNRNRTAPEIRTAFSKAICKCDCSRPCVSMVILPPLV